MKKYFLSFADQRYHPSLKRITQQAKNLCFFDGIVAATPKTLSPGFQKHFQRVLNSQTRGYGYWCWKPHIILQLLDKINPGDALLYCDAGCHLNPYGINRLADYFSSLSEDCNGLVTFRDIPPNQPGCPIRYDNRPLLEQYNYKWTKGDLLNFYSREGTQDYVNSKATGATALVVLKCEESISFIKEWLDIFYTNFSLADDSPSRVQNHPDFVENRHDQSILSMLCVKYHTSFFSTYELWYPSYSDLRVADWDSLKNCPIHIKRDIKLSFKARLHVRIKRKLGNMPFLSL